MNKQEQLEKALLQDKIDAAKMGLKLSLEDHYSPANLPLVMNLIEDIWRMMLKQEQMSLYNQKIPEPRVDTKLIARDL